jgi:hypothetical protein
MYWEACDSVYVVILISHLQLLDRSKYMYLLLSSRQFHFRLGTIQGWTSWLVRSEYKLLELA